MSLYRWKFRTSHFFVVCLSIFLSFKQLKWQTVVSINLQKVPCTYTALGTCLFKQLVIKFGPIFWLTNNSFLFRLTSLDTTFVFRLQRDHWLPQQVVQDIRLRHRQLRRLQGEADWLATKMLWSFALLNSLI